MATNLYQLYFSSDAIDLSHISIEVNEACSAEGRRAQCGCAAEFVLAVLAVIRI
jgi:hypothetical protein